MYKKRDLLKHILRCREILEVLEKEVKDDVLGFTVCGFQSFAPFTSLIGKKKQKKPKKIKCLSQWPSKNRCETCKKFGYCIAMADR